MKKAMRPAQDSERVHSIKIAKETLRRLEATGLREAAGGFATLGGASCDAPCFKN
jgi:hypothetical protein